MIETESDVEDDTRALLQSVGVRFVHPRKRTFSRQGWQSAETAAAALPQRVKAVDMEKQKRGKVARLLSDKGFGFVKDTDSQLEFFFHRSSVKGTPFEHLKEGDKVTYIEESSPKGPRAGNVEKVV